MADNAKPGVAESLLERRPAEVTAALAGSAGAVITGIASEDFLTAILVLLLGLLPSAVSPAVDRLRGHAAAPRAHLDQDPLVSFVTVSGIRAADPAERPRVARQLLTRLTASAQAAESSQRRDEQAGEDDEDA